LLLSLSAFGMVMTSLSSSIELLTFTSMCNDPLDPSNAWIFIGLLTG
jgi:hypothetical protein